MVALIKIIFCVVSLSFVIFFGLIPQALSVDTEISFENKKVSFEISLAGETQLIRGYLSNRMEGEGPYPAVILLHGCTGLDLDGYALPWKGLADHARFLNKNNFISLIIDSHGSRGITTRASWVDSCVYGKGYLERTADVDGAIKFLEKLKYVDRSKIILLGQSQCAMVVVNALRSDGGSQIRTVAAGIAYYPHCKYLTDMLAMQRFKNYFYSPILIIMGSQDNITPVRYCRKLIEVMNNNPNSSEIIPVLLEYKGAQHSFDLPLWFSSDTPIGTVASDRKATTDSRERYLVFIRKLFN